MTYRTNSLRHLGQRDVKSTCDLGWAVKDPPEKNGLETDTWWTTEADDRSTFNLGNGGRRVPSRGSKNQW